MGQQLNKIQKRRRRLAYLERRKAKAKVVAVKPTRAKKASKKKADAAVPAAAETPSAE